jgi:leucyl-tRNA synthetase
VPNGEKLKIRRHGLKQKIQKTVIASIPLLLMIFPYRKLLKSVIEKIRGNNIGYGTVNYRLRDAIFSRQRYWGEPFPVYFKGCIPYVLP